ncbi:DUF3560 domain-containing protein [Vibrio scophthalmi]|uniref:Large polyvalent protein associated domain-containing protein n=1 Tax=Vibrio scophthalmi LMG 19158 TaxID=870967 RepID=F9RIA1_9VIBR|nr:DUF3560 domain-containing protein [Vibrio scophthalmi]EGU42433.1 hypothetical protein VIS19158_11568 [Vibrio scophthalmi LMG 19158]
MTHSTAIHSTITNQQQATSVSPLEQSGSSKSEILKSFKAGKLRKNAKNKIALLLSVATKIVLKTQSMGMDDCWSSNTPKAVDVDFFWTWYEKEYSDLEIYVTVVDGVLTKVRFSDCPYHFSTDIVLTFDAIECEESEAEAVELETIEPVELATIESFNDFEEEKVIEKIEVVWSESNHFEDGEILTLAQYNEKSIMEALEIGRGQGYAKTKITVHFQGEEADTMRHDIDADYPTLNIYLAAYKIRVIEKPAKIRVTYSDVKNALEQGYISPLNHDQKQPEPTPPSDDVTSRKVVSLGDYQERLESKRERLEARAEKANAESNHYYTASKSRASMIPFGQPILVGHHSEKRARRDADRIFNDMGKSVAAARKAERLEERAANVGRNGIASDDPEAIQKLKEKLAGLERSQETMKAINKVIRSKHMTDADKIEYMTTNAQPNRRKGERVTRRGFLRP